MAVPLTLSVQFPAPPLYGYTVTLCVPASSVPFHESSLVPPWFVHEELFTRQSMFWFAVAAARLAAEAGTALGLRDAALLRLGSDGLLRISELAGVQVDDLRLAEEGSGVLALPRSKTDQEGEGSFLYVCRETMEAIAAWLKVSGITAGPLFRRVLRNRVGGDSPLSVSAVRSILQRRARAAGATGRVSGHSLRVGSAQSLVAAGASTAELMQAGRWTDAATATRYAANELAGHGAVARYFEDGDA